MIIILQDADVPKLKNVLARIINDEMPVDKETEDACKALFACMS